jgi:uncharacterized protein YggE
MRKFIFSLLLALPALFAQAQTKNFLDQPYIEVNGEADTLLMPDEIYISITISEKDTRDRVSVEEQERKMAEAFKAMGINTEKDLSVDDMGSMYRFYLLKTRDVIKTKLYLLKVRDAVTVGNVFMRLEDLDISNARISRVDHSQMKSIRSAIMVKAVENARTQASALTRALNQTLGAALHVSTTGDESTARALQGKVAGVNVRGLAGDYKLGQPAIEFEKIHVSGAVNVKFAIK